MNTKNKINTYWNMGIFTVFTLLVTALPELSMATSAGTTMIGDVVCKANEIVTSDVGKGLAIAAIVILGLAALMGKISWGLGLMVVVGIGLIFGASGILEALGVKGAGCVATV